jgi:TOMM system kinase/cyclase fusion protein
MTQVLDALAAAHAQGIVHRDLKPSNLMLSGTGARRNAVVLDFGVGGLAEGRRRAGWQTLTQAREFVGTPLYAAPEQLAGEPATPRSDLYAWGLVFLECLTGRHPFAEEAAAERLLSGGGAVEIPEWLSEHGLGQLLEQVTAREPAKRDVSVESLIEALDAMAGGELPVAPELSPTPAPLHGTGERRHLTVMFCDLVGSTALSQRLDAETYREIVRAYQARGAEAVERYDGHVKQYLGDGLVVYFGYPQAHEDDAERAIRAARELLRSLEILSAQTQARHGVPIAARVGIHTGPTVVGEMGGGEKREMLALGDTVNIAARLEGFAEPGSVVISEATRQLVSGIFVTEDRGVPELKGIQEPIRVHKILQPSGVRSRLERAPGLTPFVGREDELGLLVHRFERAQEGQGQAVLLGGEAGIGKSRLVRELRGRLRETPHSWLECQTSPYTQGSALYPLIAMLENALDFQEGGGEEEKLARLERGLAQAGLELDEKVPLFASLLSLRLPERYTPLEISPQLQRQKTLEALLAWLLALSEKQPTVLLVEDLHWIDPSTLEWLRLAIGQCPMANLLLLLTHRPEFEPPWPARGHVLVLGLDRLGRRDSKELVAHATVNATLPEPIVAQIAGRSDGVPLFAEELAKGVVEVGHSDEHEIPETLQDSLMARLDRLGEAKTVAQYAAAIGRDFPYGLLAAVSPMTEPALRDGLGRLVDAELVFQRGLPPKAVYTFKHALVEDTAYQSLLESQCRALHGRIADALESHFPERVAREPEVLAHHCAKAGRVEDAIGHYQRAGELSMERSAQAEAIEHLSRALALLATLRETSERDQHELQLQLALGASLIAVKGHGHPESKRVHERALELCEQVGEAPELVRALVGLSMFHFMASRYRLARELAERALSLAERGSDPYPLLVAHCRVGITLFFANELVQALEHLERAVAIYKPAAHRPRAVIWGQDWGISARNYLSLALWIRGYPNRALNLIRETVELARQGDPFSLAYALTWAGIVACWRGDRERALEWLDESIAICREHGFPIWLWNARLHRGAILGDASGVAELRRLAQRAEGGSPVPNPESVLLELAKLYLALGRTGDAAAELDAVLSPSTRNCELHRIRGEIFLRQGSAEAAAESLRRALELAQRIQARSWELRAAMSLARLLRDRGERDEARALLAPVYDWFTEGFDTADLKQARALLEELA